MVLLWWRKTSPRISWMRTYQMNWSTCLCTCCKTWMSAVCGWEKYGTLKNVYSFCALHVHRGRAHRCTRLVVTSAWVTLRSEFQTVSKYCIVGILFSMCVLAEKLASNSAFMIEQNKWMRQGLYFPLELSKESPQLLEHMYWVCLWLSLFAPIFASKSVFGLHNPGFYLPTDYGN